MIIKYINHIIFLNLFIIPFHSSIYSQVIYQGDIHDYETAEVISNASISVIDPSQDSLIIYYTNSDESGSFYISIAENDSLVFRVSAFNYRTNFFALDEMPKTVFLVPEDMPHVDLSEVVIKGKIDYFSKKEILEYYGDDYKDSLNTRIEDLLSNIPNITIDKNTGDIYYKNQEIKTILLDGQNLSSNEYKLLSRNITQNIVQKVSIITNYSENKVLSSFDNQSEVAIDLTTSEEYRNRITGSISLALTLNKNHNFDSHLFLLKKRIQILINAINTNSIQNKSISTGKPIWFSFQGLLLKEPSINIDKYFYSNVFNKKTIQIGDSPNLNELDNKLYNVNLVGKISKRSSISLNSQYLDEFNLVGSSEDYNSISKDFLSYSNIYIENNRSKSNYVNLRYNYVSKRAQFRFHSSYNSGEEDFFNDTELNEQYIKLNNILGVDRIVNGASGSYRLSDRSGLSFSLEKGIIKQGYGSNRKSEGYSIYPINNLLQKNLFIADSSHSSYLDMSYEYYHKLTDNISLHTAFQNLGSITTSDYAIVLDQNDIIENGKVHNDLNIADFRLGSSFASRNLNLDLSISKQGAKWNGNYSNYWLGNFKFSLNNVLYSLSGQYLIRGNYNALHKSRPFYLYIQPNLLERSNYTQGTLGNKQFAWINLSREFVRTQQSLSVVAALNISHQNYIRNIRQSNDIVFYQLSLEDNSDNILSIQVNYQNYIPKLQSVIRFEAVYSEFSFLNRIDENSSSNDLFSQSITLDYKTFLEKAVNFNFRVRATKSVYTQNLNGLLSESVWHELEFNNELLFSYPGEPLRISIRHKGIVTQNMSSHILFGEIIYRNILKNLHLSILIRNLGNEKRLISSNVAPSFLVNKSDSILGRIFMLKLKYDL